MSNSERWLREHFSDHFVKKAQKEGYVSRAAYKLIELNDRDRFLKPGSVVLDLGAAPGGWSMVAQEIAGPKGKVVALDCLPMTPMTGVDFIQGDFTEEATYHTLLAHLNQQPVDVVLSDMAPNLSGSRSIDQPRAMYLAELALDFAKIVLKPGGSLIIKIFQGEGVDAYGRLVKQHFQAMKWRKPDASRSKSRELYLVAKGLLSTPSKNTL